MFSCPYDGGENSEIGLSRTAGRLSLAFSPATRQGQAAYGGGYVSASGSENLEITDFLTEVALTENLEHRLSSCIGGAEYVENIRSMLQQSGFCDIVLKPKDNSGEIVKSWSLGENIEDYVASYDIQATRP
jgi:hypothetical protein